MKSYLISKNSKIIKESKENLSIEVYDQIIWQVAIKNTHNKIEATNILGWAMNNKLSIMSLVKEVPGNEILDLTSKGFKDLDKYKLRIIGDATQALSKNPDLLITILTYHLLFDYSLTDNVQNLLHYYRSYNIPLPKYDEKFIKLINEKNNNEKLKYYVGVYRALEDGNFIEKTTEPKKPPINHSFEAGFKPFNNYFDKLQPLIDENVIVPLQF